MTDWLMVLSHSDDCDQKTSLVAAIPDFEQVFLLDSSQLFCFVLLSDLMPLQTLFKKVYGT